MLKQITLCYLVLASILPPRLSHAADLAVSRPRPLMGLCAELREKYGLLITYEDAPYDPANELDTEIIPRNGAKSLTPKWKPITFHITPDLPTLSERAASLSLNRQLDPNQALAAAQDLVNQYNQSGNPGHFSVTQDGQYLHIQQMTRIVDGRMQPFDPISATVLSWQPKPESCQQLIGDLSDALAQARGFGVAEGSVPTGSLLMHKCSVASNSPAAGEVLQAIIAGLSVSPSAGSQISSSPYAYTWDLVYDPNWNKYFLSLISVQIDPQQTTATEQAAQPASAAVKPTPAARLAVSRCTELNKLGSSSALLIYPKRKPAGRNWRELSQPIGRNCWPQLIQPKTSPG
jgi:hypothetical protein